ncbi:MAG: alanine racemase [Clostridiales bacterium]|nr:alanine racemase [Clostridiales bacterium]
MNRRAWAEIDLDALAHNMREIRKITDKNAQICATVKADAYGHGFLEAAKTFLENGADRLAVAMKAEAIQLRKSGIDVPILILGMSPAEDIEDIIDYDITPAVGDYEFARLLSQTAQKKGKTAKIHIKIDTGMTRVGFVADDLKNSAVVDEIIKISQLKAIEVEGMFSHFSTSDEYDKTYTKLQFKRFMALDEQLRARGLNIPIRHIANSAAIMMYPNTHLEMVRPGIILYGMYPSQEVDKSRLDLKYAMSLKACVSYIKEVEAGRGVSYGKEYITDHKTKIATVPIGYADGYIRRLSGRACMIADGKKVPIIGRICMDQCMIDVTSVNNISKGDEVIIFGSEEVTIDDMAAWLDTINYEIACMISKRIPRVYLRNGKAVKTLDYLSM